ncbi:MAG: uncharacterized protein A8A55_0621 [Amphiamblys sp. WSBS2006]|nr:MAG: uncharacterized protein A8A55_0621 [Amphiamblys sp. WSBS2006]
MPSIQFTDPYFDAVKIAKQKIESLPAAKTKKKIKEAKDMVERIQTSVQNIRNHRLAFTYITDKELAAREETLAFLQRELGAIEGKTLEHFIQTDNMENVYSTPKGQASQSTMLLELDRTVQTVRNNAQTIQSECHKSNKYIDDVDIEMQRTNEKVGGITETIQKTYSEITSSTLNVFICVLFLVLIILVIVAA